MSEVQEKTAVDISKSTPRPWKVGDLAQWSIKTNARALIQELDGEQYAVAWVAGWAMADGQSQAAPEEGEANAALIALAVNHHDELVAALQEIQHLSAASIGDNNSTSIGERDAMQWLATIGHIATSVLSKVSK